MSTFEEVVDVISQGSSGSFRSASEADLAKLAQLGVPSSIIDFYRTFEPVECVEGPVRLWSIKHLIQENTELLPGYVVQPLGYVVFSTTYCGDAYCFDLTEEGADQNPGIVLISHESIGEGMTLAEVREVAKPIASSLLEFLQQFARNEIDEECL